MPDIFGRNVEDYEHIRMLQEAGAWERHQAAYQMRAGAPAHSFDALGSGIPMGLERAEPNAQALGFLTNNLLAIQAMADEVLYTMHRLPDLIHLNTNIPEGAETYAVRVTDYTGEGAYITNDGTDAPNATASQRLVPHGLDYAGIDANWTVEDLRNAMMTGLALDTESIEAAVRGALNHMERIGLTGDTARGYRGLTNLATGADNVTLTTRAASMTFDDIEPEDIRDLINDEISAIIESTEETFGTIVTDGMCVYLPVQQYNRLATRFVGDSEERSVLQAILDDNPWKHYTGNSVMFKPVQELDQAGASNADRMIVCSKDPRVFEMGVSIAPRVLRILDKGRQMCAQVEYKFSSLFVKRPTVIRYTDGI